MLLKFSLLAPMIYGCFLFPSLASAESSSRPDRVLADFEGNDYGDWEVKGIAFGLRPVGPADSDRPKVEGVLGHGYASSARKTLNAGGRLTSPPFTVDRKYLNFLVGGDKFSSTSLRVLIDGETVRVIPGTIKGKLRPWSFDLTEFQGKQAQIEIRDTMKESGSDQPIYVDQLVLSDESALKTIERTIQIQGDYLNLPTGVGEGQATLRIEVDGKVVRKADYVAPVKIPPEQWLSHRVDDLKGKTAHITIESVPRESKVEDLIVSSDEPHNSASTYQERLRPQFHFSSRSGWLNDPNGMVYANGEWHLFYQHNAFGMLIGNQIWGHAISRDLVHWEELPVVLQPYVFSRGKSYSGSAVIDKKNRTGLNKESSPLLLAYYTDTGYNPRAECLAYSTDQGRTFQYYEGNPLVQHKSNGRDPKVFWYPVEDIEQKNGHWVMVVYSKNGERDGLRILVSENGLKWEETDWLADRYECPELFRLPVLDAKGQPTGEHRWIISGGNAEYAIGEFDGRTFKTDQTETLRTLYPPAYAGQCFNDAPGGRVIQIAWLRRHVDWQDMPFSQMMSIPLEMSLHQTPEGLRLHANPVPEITSLRKESFERQDLDLPANEPLSIPLKGQLYDLDVTFTAAKGARLKINLGSDSVVATGAGLVDEIEAGLTDGKCRVRILVDRPLVEIIGNNGAVYLPKPRTDAGKDISISIVAEEGPVHIDALSVYQLKSIWGAIK